MSTNRTSSFSQMETNGTSSFSQMETNGTSSFSQTETNGTSAFFQLDTKGTGSFFEKDNCPDNRNPARSFFVFLMCLCCILTMIGNFIVIVIIARIRKGANKHTNRYILSLAVADLCVGFFVLPSSIAKINNDYYWSKPLWFCKLWVTMDVGFICVSIYNLVAISLDRLYAVYRPISYTKRSTMMVNVMILISWIMFFVVAMPMHIEQSPFSTWNSWLNSMQPFNASGLPCMRENCTTPGDHGWVIYAAILAFIIPFILLIVVNSIVFAKTRSVLVERVEKAKKEKCLEKSYTLANKQSTLDDDRAVSVNPSSSSQNVDGHRSVSRSDTIETIGSDTLDRNAIDELAGQNEDRKLFSIKKKNPKELTRAEKKLKKEEAAQTRVTAMMAVVIGGFMICWAPFAIMFVSMAIGVEALIIPDTEHILQFITWLGYVNSFLNPIIYALMNKQMKKGFKDLVSDIKNLFNKNK